jgi:hypothetical protein
VFSAWNAVATPVHLAAKEFDIPPERQNRIVVEKVKGKD